jgi:hypothetical protein
MDNVQKQNNCINIPSSHTLRSYLHNHYGPGIYPKLMKFEQIPKDGDNSVSETLCFK